MSFNTPKFNYISNQSSKSTIRAQIVLSKLKLNPENTDIGRKRCLSDVVLRFIKTFLSFYFKQINKTRDVTQ